MRHTHVRLVLFFIGTIVILAALLPEMEEASILKSPFVTVFEHGTACRQTFFYLGDLTSPFPAEPELFMPGCMIWARADGMLSPPGLSART